jgi:hypothetical protein
MKKNKHIQSFNEHQEKLDISSKRLLNITCIINTIVSNNDLSLSERNFFNWLNGNNIWWTQKGSNLDNITIYEKDFEKISNYWDCLLNDN